MSDERRGDHGVQRLFLGFSLSFSPRTFHRLRAPYSFSNHQSCTRRARRGPLSDFCRARGEQLIGQPFHPLALVSAHLP